MFRYSNFFDYGQIKERLTTVHTKDGLLTDLTKRRPSVMIVVDGDGMLKMFWLDIVLAMFDTESKAERKQTAGNVVSTDKLIQHIKEYSGVKHNMLNIQEDFGLNIKIKDRVPIDSVIAKLGTQLVLTILCQNLELYIFDLDLLFNGFMEHQCYLKCKRYCNTNP